MHPAGVPADGATVVAATEQVLVVRPFAVAVAIHPVAFVESAGSVQSTRIVPRPAVSDASTGALGAWVPHTPMQRPPLPPGQVLRTRVAAYRPPDAHAARASGSIASPMPILE